MDSWTTVNNKAKSKQNAQRNTKQAATPNNQKQTASSVPPPQPSKVSNKSNKKTELNLKGANKEGTDMDAFNDNLLPKEEVNANVNVTNQNDIINANSIQPVTTNTAETDITVNSENKKNESNEPVTIKTEIPKLPKAKESFDVTSIFREQPKPVKPFTPAAVQPRDETDQAATLNEKMVLVKNDVNAKVNTNANNVVNDIKSQLKYREDQWAPDKQDGKKIYEREFLLALKNYPASRRKPDNIPDVVLALYDDRTRANDGRMSMGGRTDFTNPPFSNYGTKSGSSQRAVVKRNSQSKMRDSKVKQPVTKLSISLREDVKLHETENAWRPARLNKAGELPTDDDKRTGTLYRKVRAVLNKLTPQKFDTLVNQVRELEIDSKERLQGVIDLVFEKAVDEPNFSVAYALMCKELQAMQVQLQAGTTDDKKYVAFRTLLVTRCQVEFEKQSSDESERNRKIQEIEDCEDPEKQKDLQFELQEYDRRLRMKSVGCIRFIGELFKQHMLTASIMKRCLQTLLDNKDEESLECLCKLLTTVGKELESKNVELKGFFHEMKEIVDGKRGKISSRIKFMLKDVIDLRNSKWVPRRQDYNPKTIDQIQKEAETEQLNIQVMNSGPMTPRKDDRGGGSSSKGRRNVSSDDGWIVNSRNRATNQITVQSDKLKNKLPLTDEPFGSSQLFGSWSRGSTIRNQPQPLGTTANIYAALENIETEKRPLRSSKDPYSSKGPSLERSSYNKSYDGRGSRSGSQHRSDNSSSSSQRSTPAPPLVIPPSVPKPIAAAQPAQSVSVVPKLTEEQIERRVNNSLDEYLNDSCSVDEYFQDIVTTVPSSYFPRLVGDSFLRVMEKSRQIRLKTGRLFAILVKSEKLPLEDFCLGFEDVLSQADDLQIDIPMVWEYLAENLVESICLEALPLSMLPMLLKVIIEQGHAPKVLSPLFNLVVKDKGPNFLQSIWQSSGLQFDCLMPTSQVDAFVKENKLEFLSGGDTPVGQSQLSDDQIQSKLSEFLKSKALFDDIVNWISANVGARIKENKFIRILATVIFENSISKNKLVPETLADHYKLLQKYVDNNPNHELQCLYALQALIQKKEHPQGLLLSICDKLYEDSTFSQESFIAWENSKDPAEQEGKGVALKQLTSFFTQLKENEDEDYGSSTSED